MKLARDIIRPGTSLQAPSVPNSFHCMMLFAYSTFFACARTIESQGHTYEVLDILSHDGSSCKAFLDEVSPWTDCRTRDAAMLDPRTSRMITATPSVYKPARQQRLVLTRRNTGRSRKNFLYFTTSNTVRDHSPSSRILWLHFTSCPTSTIAYLWTKSMSISHKQGLYARLSVDLCIGCTPLSS